MVRQWFFGICCVGCSLFAAPLVIGIAGGSGSGKTTLAKNLQSAFPGSVLICQDMYYKDFTHLPFGEREIQNFDHPSALEFSLLREHLLAIKNGEGIALPTYEFATYSRSPEFTWIAPTEIVIVEGILLFAAPEVRDLFDLKIFVDTDADVRVVRRIDRDLRERSYSLQVITQRYLDFVKPMHDLFVEPSKKYADLIVPEGGNNEVANSVILAFLQQINACGGFLF
jgi:uridine kinase